MLLIKPSILYDMYKISNIRINENIVWNMFFPLNFDDNDVVINPIIHDRIIGIIGKSNNAIIEDI